MAPNWDGRGMFLEGEVNWTAIFAVLAVAGHVAAIVAIWFAVRNGGRHVDASGELNLVQKVAEAADKRLFQTLNAVPVAIVETDKQGKFVFANRAAHQLLGRRDAELLGLRFHSATWGITYPDGRPIPPDMLPSARALRGQTIKGFHHVIANPQTRRQMIVSATAMPIEDDYGTVIGSTSVLVETEGLVTAGPVMPEPPPPIAPADDLTRRVFEVATSALVVVSAHGVVREANRTALDGLGRSQGVVGEDFADQFLAEDARVEGRQTLRAALAARPGEAEPLIARTPDGQTMAWRILPLSQGDDRPDALLLAGDLYEEAAPEPAVAPEPVEEPVLDTAIPDDATVDPEREALHRDLADARADAETALADAELVRRQLGEAQAQLARADAEVRTDAEAARRLESVGRVTGGVAQDFTALLAVMTSALDMMLKQADDPSRVRRLGEAALAAGRRGEVMTRRLSAFSDSQEAAASAAPLDAGLLLRSMEASLRALAGLGVDLMIEGPSQPAPVRLDPVAFEGAVRALVVNAVEAVNGSGSVAVRLEATPEGARLSVRDSGPGMDPDTLARAREAFFTTKPEAAGLGLAQVQAFARQSGGDLSIDSAPGAGSEVCVTLPGAASD